MSTIDRESNEQSKGMVVLQKAVILAC